MLKKIAETTSTLARIFRTRFDKSPIDKSERLVVFLHTRSAYVAQTSLYGYLKTRMGRDYVSIFKDERFAPSLNAAKWTMFAACLSDLTVYSIALATRSGGLDRREVENLARHCHGECVRETFEGEIAEGLAESVIDDFNGRCTRVVWANVAIGENAFSVSPVTLAESSPVSDEFKRLDREIVMNSVRFRWNDIRDQLRRRLDGAALCSDWRQRTSSGEVPAAAEQEPKLLQG